MLSIIQKAELLGDPENINANENGQTVDPTTKKTSDQNHDRAQTPTGPNQNQAAAQPTPQKNSFLWHNKCMITAVVLATALLVGACVICPPSSAIILPVLAIYLKPIVAWAVVSSVAYLGAMISSYQSHEREFAENLQQTSGIDNKVTNDASANNSLQNYFKEAVTEVRSKSSNPAKLEDTPPVYSRSPYPGG